MATASSTSAGAASPSSSPRLPSPPPFTEDQIGPKSPTVGDGFSNTQNEQNATEAETSSARRTRPGTKAADMTSGPPLVPLNQLINEGQLDSPFQLQEHLAALYSYYTSPPPSKTTIPLTRDKALRLAQAPASISPPLWLYELCRFLTLKANALIVAFFALSPPCSAQTCSEMRASEWQYLCAVHDPPKACCAIDYCCHTLDWASNLLTSPSQFPSRMSLNLGASTSPPSGMSQNTPGIQQSIRHLTNIFRRVYRIFAHAWFQHRSVFWQVEGHDGLYILFKTVCDVYGLIPEDNYTIPSEAEVGSDGGDVEGETPIAKTVTEKEAQTPAKGHGRSVTILSKKRDSPPDNVLTGRETIIEKPAELAVGGVETTVSTGATTRKHKTTPSTGLAVTTIDEANEVDNDDRDDITVLEVGMSSDDEQEREPTVTHEPESLTSEEPGEGEIIPEKEEGGEEREKEPNPETEPPDTEEQREETPAETADAPEVIATTTAKDEGAGGEKQESGEPSAPTSTSTSTTASDDNDNDNDNDDNINIHNTTSEESSEGEEKEKEKSTPAPES
ncbi:MAG: hypothetical protein M1834_003987 [Cirrosporium novae-zelandiae]|nr:MAG: hypothetical protein M1834_003987 [Cirrosporium novae-zelandiae]